jgi:excinuclease ABC subunit B
MAKKFKLDTELQPTGDQPKAIEQLLDGLNKGMRYQTLLGVTGSGKTFTMANIIEAVQRPTLVIAHNKTLAAQLCAEFRDLFPKNRVEYFVSYYDYYQPEAYVPSKDLYIEKDSDINEEVDRLRHSATQAVLTRRDTIIVATVSCIYGLGSPEDYSLLATDLKVGGTIDRAVFLRRLIDMRYRRNDTSIVRGTFRIRGDTLELQPPNEEVIYRIGFFGDEIEGIFKIHPVTGEVLEMLDEHTIFPATHYVLPPEKLDLILAGVEAELEERLKFFHDNEKLLEEQRLRERTRYDLEMIRELGYCSGIENYSRHFDGRHPGEPPSTLVEYFPDDFLCIVDESHATLPQLRGMYKGDFSRKSNLVEYGFRMPSALDNRPLRFEEWEKLVNQAVFTTATPGAFERENSSQVVELVIRPTGLIDPEIIIRPVGGQVDDLIDEIHKRVEENERVLVTTLTKKMSEDLADYLGSLKLRVKYLHSDIDTLERVRILRDLRRGEFDVLVGINLLREGLDLPEVSLVAILDADKAGFLRSETSLIQTMGRAARHIRGQVILYADDMTEAIKNAVRETDRRRKKQTAHNEKYGITPVGITKRISDIAGDLGFGEPEEELGTIMLEGIEISRDELPVIIDQLRTEMLSQADELNFEKAAEIRDEIKQLEKFLAGKASKAKKGRKKKKKWKQDGRPQR